MLVTFSLNASTVLNIYIIFCTEYAQNLLAKKRYSEVVEVLAFIMSTRGEETGVSYALISQVFLKTMAGKFPEDREHGRLFIDFFAHIYNEEDYEKIQ